MDYQYEKLSIRIKKSFENLAGNPHTQKKIDHKIALMVTVTLGEGFWEK